MRTVSVAFGAAIVAFVLWALQRRKKRKSLAFFPSRGTASLSGSGLSSRNDSTSAKAADSVSRGDAYNSLLGVCRDLETALSTAAKSGDVDREYRLRRVLCRVYAALEAADVSVDYPPTVDDHHPHHRSSHALHFGGASIHTSFRSMSGAHLTATTMHPHDDIDDDASSITSYQSANVFFATEEDESDDACADITLTLPQQPAEESTSLLYDLALEKVSNNLVEYRKDRTRQTGCTDKEDFLARLDIIREASETMLMDLEFRRWFIDFGAELLSGLLELGPGGKEAGQFKEHFYEMMAWLERMQDEGRLEEVLAEFTPRGVVYLSVFDIALDIILLDAFDDLETLPSTVTSVLNSQWILNSVKETTLTTAIRSVCNAKEQKSQPDGAFKRIYAMFKLLSPSLACGLLGCTASPTFNDLCKEFRDFIDAAVTEWFQFDATKYDDVDALADDMKVLWRQHATTARALLAKYKAMA